VLLSPVFEHGAKHRRRSELEPMTGIEPAYVDVVDVLLNGAYYTVEAELPAH
jgi:hypothetical protein